MSAIDRRIWYNFYEDICHVECISEQKHRNWHDERRFNDKDHLIGKIPVDPEQLSPVKVIGYASATMVSDKILSSLGSLVITSSLWICCRIWIPSTIWLTRFDCCQRCQKSNGVHNALFSFESSRSQNPCRDRMNDEHIEEKSSKTGEVVTSCCFVRHFVLNCL